MKHISNLKNALPDYGTATKDAKLEIFHVYPKLFSGPGIAKTSEVLTII